MPQAVLKGTVNSNRVAFISPVGDIGGAERVIAAIASGMENRAIDHRVFCLREGDWTRKQWSNETKVSAFSGGYRIRQPWRLWQAVRWLRKQLKQYQPTIIHANHGAWWLTALAARRMNVTKIWHLYDFPDRRDIQVLAGEYLSPTGVIFTGEYVSSGHPKLMRLPHAFIRPVTIEPLQFVKDSPDFGIVNKVICLNERFLLTVARWQPHKGFSDLVDAVSLLHSRGTLPPDVRFVIIGKPANPDQVVYQHEVINKMRSCNVFDKFVMVDRCSDSELLAFYQKTVALVHPATSEGFGLTLIEAMSVGVPIIACDASGPSEILEDGRYGCVIPKRNPQLLADAIHRIVQDATFQRQLRAKSLERSPAFSREKMIEQTMQFYSSLNSDNRVS